jgi:hypothetical protein
MADADFDKMMSKDKPKTGRKGSRSDGNNSTMDAVREK